MKPRVPFSLSRLVLALVLLAALTAGLSAAAVPADRPVVAAGAVPAKFLDTSRVSTNRTTVVRIAAVGMALALMIMYRSKH